jgi:hypothetical protein
VGAMVAGAGVDRRLIDPPVRRDAAESINAFDGATQVHVNEGGQSVIGAVAVDRTQAVARAHEAAGSRAHAALIARLGESERGAEEPLTITG